MEQFRGRDNFDNAFQTAFSHAEIAPSPTVWGNIEMELAKATNSNTKKRLFVLQLVAAASLVFATAIGFYQFFGGPLSPSTQESSIISENIVSGEAKEPNTPGNEKSIAPITIDKEEAAKPKYPIAAESEKDLQENQALSPVVSQSTIVADNVEPHESIETLDSNQVDQANPSSLAPTLISLQQKDAELNSNLEGMDLLFIPVWKKKRRRQISFLSVG